MNSQIFCQNIFITPVKKESSNDQNLSMQKTDFTTKNEENNNWILNTTPHCSTIKDEELTSPLIKSRRRSITPFYSSDEEGYNSRKDSNEAFDLNNFNELKKKVSFSFLSKETSLEEKNQSNVLRYNENVNESICKDSIEILNDLKGSILLFSIENQNNYKNFNSNVNYSLKPFFEVNQLLFSKIIKDLTFAFFEGFNSRNNSLFFKYFSNSTKFDIINQFNGINESVKFLEEKILTFIPFREKSQIDFIDNEEDKFIYSVKGECKQADDDLKLNFILSLKTFVNLIGNTMNSLKLNEFISFSEVKLLIFE